MDIRVEVATMETDLSQTPAPSATTKPDTLFVRPSTGDQAMLEDVLQLRSLFANNHLSDVVFVFSHATGNHATSTNDSDQRMLTAHRLVLSLRSGAFHSALLRAKSSQVAGQVRFPIKIIIEDTSFPVFSVLLRYMYTNEIVVDPASDTSASENKREEREQFWKELLRAAFVYLVPSLVDICVDQLTSIVDLTASDSAELKHLRRILDLLVYCDEVLSTKPNATHRRSSVRPQSELVNGARAGIDEPTQIEDGIARGLDRCLVGLKHLQTLCLSALDIVPSDSFEALMKSDSAKQCTTERLCEILKRRSTAPLVVAIRYQLTRVVNEFLRTGEPLDQSDASENDLPLVAAIKTGNQLIIRRLLVDASAPYFLLTDKIPLIFLACAQGIVLHCETLIQERVEDVNLISPLEDGDKEILAEYGRRQTPLHIASKHGHVAVVELLLKSSAASNLPDEEGNTPLHRASNIETAAVLLRTEYRTNCNIPNRRGQTALHVAAANGNVGVVNMLINNGADQDIVDDQGQSAFHIAAANGHTSVALVLLHENEEREQIMRRRSREESTLAQLTVAKSDGVSESEPEATLPTHRIINQEDHKGNTALHLAAMSPSERCQKMLQLLLENGADPNRSNWFGYTPIHLFCSHQTGPASVIDVFIEHGANIHTQSLDGSTPLHLAVGRASEEVAVALVIAGAHVHLQDAAGRTVVDLAETSNQGVLLVPVLRNLSRAPEWVPDDQVQDCSSCHGVFRVAMRKHHCRHCGRVICYNCSSNKIAIPKFQLLKPSRVCDTCYDVLSFRRLL